MDDSNSSPTDSLPIQWDISYTNVITRNDLLYTVFLSQNFKENCFAIAKMGVRIRKKNGSKLELSFYTFVISRILHATEI